MQGANFPPTGSLSPDSPDHTEAQFAPDSAAVAE